MKSGKALLALAGLICVSTSTAAMAEDAPYATYEIRLEKTAVQTKAPVLTTPVSKDTVAFHIENNTGKAVYFVKGDQKEYIPVVSNATVSAPYGQEAYTVVDNEGQVVASWKLLGNQGEKANVVSASKEQFVQWGEQIQQVIQSTQNRSVSYEYKSEPASYQRPAAEEKAPIKKNTVIRGFW